jgi:large subunit ribosomal protein L32e
VEEELEEEEEEEYIVKQKPELTSETKAQLHLRSKSKKKKPKFRRQEWFRYKRLSDNWRKPRGLHSKMRKNLKYRINKVRIGYKTSEAVRGLHSSGFKEKLVFNKSDLDSLDPKIEAARIGHSVGTRKRIEIEEYADELGIRVLNRGA